MNLLSNKFLEKDAIGLITISQLRISYSISIVFFSPVVFSISMSSSIGCTIARSLYRLVRMDKVTVEPSGLGNLIV